ncbi:MAG: LPS-assembly protein LptD [Caulobacteraceae bacterium]|nr:LPS-assembly protein LptD [Caulobacteraceae bacterium]
MLALAPAAALASPREGTLPALGAAPAKPAGPPPPSDGLAGGGFYIEADELTQDQQTNRVTAHGHVVARYQGRTVKAGKLVYDSTTGIVTASEGVTVINPDGTVEFARTATLNRTMSQGVAMAFSTRLKGGVSVAAAGLVRKSDLRNELNEAIFTPCPVCAKHPKPTWSIRARKAVEDKRREIVYFRDAIIEVHGLPVFFTPVFWQADPSVARKSGFLIPTVTTSTLRGFSWEQPYLQVISPSEDVVVSPQFNSKVNPFLNVAWRKRFYSGAFDLRAGYTHERDFDSHGEKFGDLTSRSYILGKGLFAIDRNWRWGFTAERASDPLIFEKYAIDDPYVERGLYAADDQRLISQLYTVRQTQTSYISVAAISVQGLRATDINATFPTVAPLIEAHFEPSTPVLGGRLRLDGSGVVLNRDQSPVDPTLAGIDSRRATAQADWRRTFIVGPGIRIDPFIQGRVDFFSLSNLQPPSAKHADITRAFGTAGFDVTWPFFRRTGAVTWILSPIAQLALSPATKQDPRIPNEDSIDFEFDTTNLFEMNKSPGFDLYEGGQRLNVGAQASAELDDGRDVSVLVGRSFRAKADPNLPAFSGLSHAASDWVMSAEGTPIKGLDFFTRFRLDSGTFSINRLELGADVNIGRFNGTIRYLDENPDPNGQVVKDLDFRGELFVTKNWGVTAYGAREFESGVWTQRAFGVIYRNECVRVDVVYTSNETFNRTLGPSSGFVFRLSLATLGNSVYSPASTNPSP